MALPVMKHPTFELTVPSSKQKIKYRPFLVKEEKILLIAQSSDTIKDMIIGIKQIIKNCIVEGDINVDTLPSFDIEYIFLKLRVSSVSGTTELSFTDADTNKAQKVFVELNNIEVTFPKEVYNIIDVGQDVKLSLRYPTYSDLTDIDLENDAAKGTMDMIKLCTEQVISGKDQEQVDQFKDYSDADVDTFLDSLQPDAFKDLQFFFTNMPKLEHTVEYKIGKETKLHTFSGIQDFFSYA